MIDWFDGIELKQTEKNKIRSENIYIMSFNKCGLRTQKLNWNFRIMVIIFFSEDYCYFTFHQGNLPSVATATETAGFRCPPLHSILKKT